MDLGCMDLGCIEKKSSDAVGDSEIGKNESASASSKIGKSKMSKEPGLPSVSVLNKNSSQIKKPLHRKTSPLNWFPRQKVDSYLKRKIKLLQEVGGMNSTLDETLGDSNPHYSKVLKEKMALREAADKAIETRKAAMVEASWCRILQAATIPSKEAEARLLEAETAATQAFEAATAIGVIMERHEMQASSLNGVSTAHTVTASFETAFEVDRQVAAAVKCAFGKLVSCPSINRDDLKELLRKTIQFPDTEEDKVSSECESDLESVTERDDSPSEVLDSEKLNMRKLTVMMLERLRCLNEDELASLATIVATCGLNAALAEAKNSKQLNSSSSDHATVRSRRVSMSFGQMRRKPVEAEVPSLDKFLVKHMTKLERMVEEAKKAKMKQVKEKPEDMLETSNTDEVRDSGTDSTQSDTIPDLGSIFVKHSSKLEKEIEEAKKKNSQNLSRKGSSKSSSETEAIPGLGSFLTRKHTSKLEKDIEESKSNCRDRYEMKNKKSDRANVSDAPSLDKCLVKRVSKLEREVQEAKDRRNLEPSELKKQEASGTQTLSQKCVSVFSDDEQVGKENIDQNKGGEQDATSLDATKKVSSFEVSETENSLDKILVKPVHWSEREKSHPSAYGTRGHQKNQEANVGDSEGGLDKVLVKRVSKLEKEKLAWGVSEESVMIKRRDLNRQSDISEGSLDQILVKHKSRLEREKVDSQQLNDQQQPPKPFLSRREARERELQEAWGGIGLGNSVRPQLSRLERDKAAWLEAEVEERGRSSTEV